MLKERITVGLVLFGLAGICVLVAWFWPPGMVAELALWFGAASFTWKGFRALLGKTSRPQTQTTAQVYQPTQPDSALRSPTNPAGPYEPPRNHSPVSASRDSGTQDTNAVPLSMRTDHGEAWRSVKSTAGSTVRSMMRFTVVLALILLVPVSLGITIGGIVTLCKGNMPKAGFMFVAAGFLMWYLCGPLRRFWKSTKIEADNLNDVFDTGDGSDE